MIATRFRATLFLLAAFTTLFIAGCAGPQRPPTALERHFFDIETNTWPELISQARIIARTNADNSIITSTNYVTVTNQVTEYALTPNAQAGAVGQIGGIVGNFFGLGGAVSTGLAGLFAAWASVRSRKNGQTAASLAQIIQTGRSILAQLPNGAALEDQYKTWMIQHQADAGTISEVAKLLGTAVNNDSAQIAAKQIVDLIAAAQAGTNDASPAKA